jgi:hypothetical protein
LLMLQNAAFLCQSVSYFSKNTNRINI